jgi:hypothetical protein
MLRIGLGQIQVHIVIDPGKDHHSLCLDLGFEPIHRLLRCEAANEHATGNPLQEMADEAAAREAGSSLPLFI